MLQSAKHPFDIDHKNGQCRYIQKKKFFSGRPVSFEGSPFHFFGAGVRKPAKSESYVPSESR